MIIGSNCQLEYLKLILLIKIFLLHSIKLLPLQPPTLINKFQIKHMILLFKEVIMIEKAFGSRSVHLRTLLSKNKIS